MGGCVRGDCDNGESVIIHTYSTCMQLEMGGCAIVVM